MTEPHDANDFLVGPESISPDDVAVEFAVLEELKRTEEVQSIDEVGVLEGNVFGLDEVSNKEYTTGYSRWRLIATLVRMMDGTR